MYRYCDNLWGCRLETDRVEPLVYRESVGRLWGVEPKHVLNSPHTKPNPFSVMFFYKL